MAVESKKKWVKVPLGGLALDRPVETDGGVKECVGLEFRSSKGAATAMYQDEIASDSTGELRPVQGAPTPHAISQALDTVNDSAPYAMLTKAPGGDVTGFFVRGFKKFDGTVVGTPDEPMNGWADAVTGTIPVASPVASLDQSAREVRLHGTHPKWYGVPRSLTKTSYDFSYDTRFTDPNGLTCSDLAQNNQSATIDGPFGDENVLRAPLPSELFVEQVFDDDHNNSGIGGHDPGNNTPTMFGENGARFRRAYFAASYLYDGYQESPLTILNGLWSLHEGTTTGYESIWVELHIKGLSNQRIPKRVRKIRIYCAGFEENHPPTDFNKLTFRLVNEIDVGSEAIDNNPDPEQTFVRIRTDRFYSGSRFKMVAEATAAGEIQHVSVWLKFGMMDGNNGATEYLQFDEAAPRFSFVGGDNVYHPQVSNVSVGLTQTQVSLKVPDSELPALTVEIARLGIVANSLWLAPITMFWGFRRNDLRGNSIDHFIHRTFIGDELLTRPTYTDLSGLPQNIGKSTVSPARLGGTSKTSVPCIWGVSDEEGVIHTDWLQPAMFAPSSLLTQDRFLPGGQVPVEFPIVDIVPGAGYDIIFGRNRLEMRSLIDDAKLVGKAWPGIGCVSAKSICATPYGTFFLSDDGVRAVAGLEVTDPVSDPIRPRLLELAAYWKNAEFVYSTRLNRLEVIIPYSTSLANGSTRFVYDFLTHEWAELVEVRRVDCATLGVDGHALIAMSAPDYITGGVFKSGASSDQIDDAHYKARVVFGDPLHEKRIHRARLFYSPGKLKPVQVEFNCERQDVRPTSTPAEALALATATRNFTFNPSRSGQESKGFTLLDRAFDVTIRNTHKIDALWLDIEPTDKAYEP